MAIRTRKLKYGVLVFPKGRPDSLKAEVLSKHYTKKAAVKEALWWTKDLKPEYNVGIILLSGAPHRNGAYIHPWLVSGDHKRKKVTRDGRLVRL